MLKSSNTHFSRWKAGAMENTPENQAVVNGKHHFYITVGHFVSQLLENSSEGKYTVNVGGIELTILSSLDEIVELFEFKKEEFGESIHDGNVNYIEVTIHTIFQEKIARRLEERINELYKEYEEKFKSFLEVEKDDKSIHSSLVKVELQEIESDIGKLEASQIDNGPDMSDTLENQRLNQRKNALENGGFYIKGEELLQRLEAKSDMSETSEGCLFPQKDTFEEFKKQLFVELSVDGEEFNDLIFGQSYFSELVNVYTNFMMLPYHQQINREQQRISGDVMSLLKVTHKLKQEVEEKFY